MRRLIPIVSVLLLVAAAFILLSHFSTSAAEGAALAPTATPGVAVNSVPVSANIDVGSLGSPRVLAWNPNVPQLAWNGAKGQPVPLAKPASAKPVIINCSKSTPTVKD